MALGLARDLATDAIFNDELVKSAGSFSGSADLISYEALAHDSEDFEPLTELGLVPELAWC